MEIQFENLIWKFSLEMIIGNLDGNLVGSLEIQFGNFDGNLDGNIVGSLKIYMEIQFGNFDGNLDRNLVWKLMMEIQLEILILGKLDPWKFSFKIQNENLVGND